MNQINIQLSCPSCTGKMYSVKYDAPLKFLKNVVGKFAKVVDFKEAPMISKEGC